MFVKIDEQLFVSSFITSGGLGRLKKLGVKTVINLSGPIENLSGPIEKSIEKTFKGSGVNYVSVNLDLPTEEMYKDMLSKICGCTVIHCVFGGSSSCAAVAYLAAKGVPVPKAIEIVVKKTGYKPVFSGKEITLFERLRENFLAGKLKALRVRASEKRVVRLRRPLRG